VIFGGEKLIAGAISAARERRSVWTDIFIDRAGAMFDSAAAGQGGKYGAQVRRWNRACGG
jgi:hypothetical protein